MSLPDGNWIICPNCNSVDGPYRQGKVGISQGRIGSRERTVDSNQLYCVDCKSYFRSSGATRREVMGFNASGDDKVAV